MANSAQLAIRDVVADLLADASIAAGRVHKNRDFPLSLDVPSQVHVNLSGSSPQEGVVYTSHPRDWVTSIDIVFLARKEGGVEAADCADALWTAAYALVMGDDTFGGSVAEVVPGDVFIDDGEGAGSLCRLRWEVRVMHRTANNTVAA